MGHVAENLRQSFLRVFPDCVALGQAVAFNMFLAFFPMILFALGILSSMALFQDVVRDLPAQIQNMLPGRQQQHRPRLFRPPHRPSLAMDLARFRRHANRRHASVHRPDPRLPPNRQTPRRPIVHAHPTPRRHNPLPNHHSIPGLRNRNHLRPPSPPLDASQLRPRSVDPHPGRSCLPWPSHDFRARSSLRNLPPRPTGYEDWHDVFPGAAVATILWWIVDIGFGFYVRYVPYGTVYRGLAAVIGLLLWMYLTAMVIFIGAAYNAVTREGPFTNDTDLKFT